MAERIINDSAGHEIKLKKGEEVITTAVFLVIPGGTSRPGGNWLIDEVMDPTGNGGYYDKDSMRVVTGGKNGRVTVIAKPRH